jgi:hypothetical protein
MLLRAALAAVAVDVQGPSECPTNAEVLAYLHPLLESAPSVGDRPHVARIDPVEQSQDDVPRGVRLRLYREDGHLIGDRVLSPQGSCEEAADAVATIIAAWESAPSPSMTPKPQPPADVIATTPPPAVNRPGRPAFDVGFVVGSALIGGLAAAAGLELTLGPGASLWRLRVGAMSETSRRMEASQGQVDWSHTAFAVSLMMRSRHPAWLLAADVGPMVGWARMEGNNFTINRQQRSFEYGATAGLRAGRTLGRVALWAEVRAQVWARGQQALVGGAASGDLPLADVAACLGMSVRIF